MKIVKQFDDPDYYKKHFYLDFEPGEPIIGFWRWGLGEDGKLYCQSSDAPNIWADSDQWNVDFQDMIRIVKQFGHLVVFT